MILKADIKNLFSEIKAGLKFVEPMKAHTSLGIGGPADVFITPEDPGALSHVIRVSRQSGIPVVTVGGGTNLLVGDRGIEGVVVCMAAFKDMDVREDSDGAIVRAGAGLRLQRLVDLSKNNGLTGIEGLAGIPGQVGGAIAGNSGAFGFEIKDTVLNITLMDPEGKIRTVDKGQINFGYRKTDIPEAAVILSAELRLGKNNPQAVSERINGFLKEKKTGQPLGQRSAGCVFKNPGDRSAGRLIDEAGCKGMRVGGIEVSSVHANFFVNTGEGSADDFLRLMDKVSQAVKAAFNIVLEPEIKIIGKEGRTTLF